MESVLIVTGSPSSSSRTARLAAVVGERLARLGADSSLLDVRSLPAEDLLGARTSAPAIESALARVASARGIVVATPVYKAAYSGVLKTFIDLLPQFGLREKVVLPLATGGTLSHVLSIDYALRPVLSSLDPLHIVAGLFVLDKQLTVTADGGLELEPELSLRLDGVIAAFLAGLRRGH